MRPDRCCLLLLRKGCLTGLEEWGVPSTHTMDVGLGARGKGRREAGRRRSRRPSGRVRPSSLGEGPGCCSPTAPDGHGDLGPSLVTMTRNRGACGWPVSVRSVERQVCSRPPYSRVRIGYPGRRGDWPRGPAVMPCSPCSVSGPGRPGARAGTSSGRLDLVTPRYRLSVPGQA